MIYNECLQKSSRSLLLFFLLFGNLQNVSAQSPALPNVISSSSPTAAGLSRYIDFPVSLSNGVPDISIPIYTLTSSRLKVPISLSYHSGGIKVVDRTSTMGLGWTMSAGGVINRVIHGFPDELIPNTTLINGGWLNTVWPSDVLGSGSSLAVNNPNEICVANHLFNTYITGHLYDNMWDGQPDLYFFSAPGLGGKFLYRNSPDASGERAVVIPYQPIKISNPGSTSPPFTITAADGNIYQFGVATDYNTADITSTSPYNSTSAWYLSKMISADGSDEVNFIYSLSTTLQTTKIPSPSTKAHYNYNLTGGNTTPSLGGIGNVATVTTASTATQSMEQNAVLTEITSKNTDVIFNYTTISESMKPLQSIDIYSITNGIKQKIKTYTFTITQFTSGGANALRLDAVTETGYLNGVATSNPPYQITYATTDAPPYDSKAQDLWGYYNGQTSNTDLTLITAGQTGSVIQFTPAKRTPNATAMMKGMIQSIKYPTGGVSNFTFEPNQISTTTTTTTPTTSTASVGTVNTMNMVPGSSTTGIDLTFTMPDVPLGYLLQSYTFSFWGELNSGCTNCLNNTPQAILYDLTSNTLIANPVLTQLQSGTLTTQTITFNNLALSVGRRYRLYLVNQGTLSDWSQFTKYRLAASVVQNLLGPSQTQTQTQTILAGGLRIKKIAHTDPITGQTLQKTFNYTKPYFTCPSVFDGDYFDYFIRYGARSKWWFSNFRTSPTDPFNTYISNIYYPEFPTVPVGGSGNSSVAYQEVEEMQTNNLDGTTLGKTVYTFNTATDYIPGRVPTIRFDHEDVRKQLLNTKIYKNISGNLVLAKEVTNTYNNVNDDYPETAGADNIKFFVANSDYDFANLVSTSPPSSGIWSAAGCTIYEKDIPFTLLALYYNVSKNFLASSTATDYDGATPVTTTTNYTYGNYAHMQPTQITTTDSKSQLKTETIKYPLDFSNITGTSSNALGIKNLQNLHVITAPVEKSSYLKNLNNVQGLTSSMFTTYHPTLPLPAQVSMIEAMLPITNFTPASVVSGDISKDPKYQPRLSFAYDITTANTTEQQKVNDTKQSYIWDYNSNYPIAQAMGGAVAEIAHTSFEADGKGNWTYTGTPAADVTSPTGKKAFTIVNSTNNITKSGLSATGTYIVSYWKKSGTIAVNGTTPITGKTINGWTYYEHKVVNPASGLITVSGTSGLIDELRLYPSTAQMTTYTYDPLIGVTTQCDPNNKITYYEYDGFGRLKTIRDQDKNVIKTLDYQYQKPYNQ